MRIELMNEATKKGIEERVRRVATSGGISQAKESIHVLYRKNTNYENNLKLAQNIVNSGHTSIAEHDHLTFFITGVSPIIEQILINQRLVSFTVKSRRYVNFSNSGFYVPDFSYLKNSKEVEKKYVEHMQSLFETYSKMVELEIPKEDARFILPYCFHSEISMTINARSLIKLIEYCLTSKMSQISEVREFGLKMLELAKEKVPYFKKIYDKLDKYIEEKQQYEEKSSFLDKYIDDKEGVLAHPKLISVQTDYENYPLSRVDRTIIVKYIMSEKNQGFEKANKIFDKLSEEERQKIMYLICTSNEQRELEHVHFSFELPTTLAGLTHLTRQRMQSPLVPDFLPVYDLKNYIVPETIKEICLEIYEEAVNKNIQVYEELKQMGVEEKDLVYFNLSGTMINVPTNINGRELLWISRLRCCNRAQWEIRQLFNEVIEQVKKQSELYGSYLGSSCAILGICPEGKKSCGTPQERSNQYILKRGK